MSDPAAHEARSLPFDGPTLNGTALRSTKAGLVSLGLVSFALATFGPWFNLLLGYGLMAASMAVAVVGIAWADRALHKTRRNPALTNGIYAKSGAALSIVAMLLSMYYTGLLLLVLFFLPIVLIVLQVAWAFHLAWVGSDAASEARA